MSSTADHRALARRLWQSVEPLHAIVYFAPEVADSMSALGIEGWWAGYFAGRAAVLGRCEASVVQALFFGFAPARVGRAIPSVWNSVSPDQVIEARLEALDRAMRRILGDDLIASDQMAAVAELLDAASHGAASEGRALFAAHADMLVPPQTHLAAWRSATLLREHRGDGHNAALVCAGLDGAEANRVALAAGVVPDGDLQRLSRGWTETEWADAAGRLVGRGLLGPGGRLSADGRSLRAFVEDRTDAAAVGPVAALGVDRCRRLIELLDPLVERIVESRTLVYPNAVGVTPRPADHQPR